MKRKKVSSITVTFVLLSVSIVLPGLANAQAAQEEFVGPFPSWRQVQCGGIDDTLMLQNQLNALGRGGSSPVLYIKAGTCRITSTLRLGQGAGGSEGLLGITILGHSPATTKILWAGLAGSGQRMIEVKGVAQSRFGRLTWDGAGRADIVYFDAWSGSGNFFPSGNLHHDEVFQNLLPSGGIAIMAGAAGHGGSETSYIRCRFNGPMQAAIFLANGNALNHWVWDSRFQNVQRGVTNSVAGRGGGGGGMWSVNRSAFLSNTHDMYMGNTTLASSRWNYSRGSRFHLETAPIGAVAAPFTVQGTTFIDPAQTSSSFIGQGAVGAIGVLDTTVRGGIPKAFFNVLESYSSTPGGDIWSLHNTFSQSSLGNYGYGFGKYPARDHLYTDDVIGATITDPGPPPSPAAPAQSTLPVIEVQNGDIAGALLKAGNQRVIVHIPYGTYHVTRTLRVGPNVILTGDGNAATRLQGSVDPVLHLAGPSHAVLRDFSLSNWAPGGRAGSGILIDNADQPGGLVHIERLVGSRNDAGLHASGLRQTVIDLIDSQISNNTYTDNSGGANPSVDYRVNDAIVHIYNSAGANSDAIYDVRTGELVTQNAYFEQNPAGKPTNFLQPNSNGTFVYDIGAFNPGQGDIDTSTFLGNLTVNGMFSTARGRRTFGPNSLVMGLRFGSATDTMPPTFLGGPYALWLPRRNTGTGATVIVPEQVAGVTAKGQFIRNHFAPLRNARPLSLAARTAGVTDVRIYNVGASLTRSGIRVVGGTTIVGVGVATK
jgi:hypothetical protein